MVHLTLVSDDRRARAREAKRQRVLAAAGRVIDRDGLAGLTMAAVADELDCAVGTLYAHVGSKAGLVAALQAQAVEVLLASHRTARAGWDEALAGEGLDPALAALVQLQAFGGFVSAAAVVFADEVQLQRQLLTQPPGRDEDQPDQAGRTAARWLSLPTALLDEGAARGAVGAGDAADRAVRWLAALDGVLLLDALAGVDRHRYRAAHHARALTADLLVGWGASRADVEVAASHVERLAALGPLAPPPDLPGT